MANYFYDLPTTSKRRNHYIHPLTGSKDVQIVNLPYRHGPQHEDGLALVKVAVSSLVSAF